MNSPTSNLDIDIRLDNQRDAPKFHFRPGAASVRSPDSDSDSLEKRLEQLRDQISNLNFASRLEVRNAVITSLCQLSNGIAAFWFCPAAEETESIECQAKYQTLTDQVLDVSDFAHSANQALAAKSSRIERQGKLTVVMVPLCFFGQLECLVVVLNLGNSPAEPFLLLSQLVASQVEKRIAYCEASAIDEEADHVAAVAELMSEILRAKSAAEAATITSNELARYLNAEVIAVGYAVPRSRVVKTTSVSGLCKPTGKSAVMDGYQAVLVEATLNDQTIMLADQSEHSLPNTLAHRSLLRAHPGCRITSTPLRTNNGQLVGSLFVVSKSCRKHPDAKLFLSATSTLIADAILGCQKANENRVARSIKDCLAILVNRPTLFLAIAVFLLALIALIPVQHKIACQCTTIPVERRFVVAPHSGILVESFVKPGETVQQNQLLAIMDQREFKMQLDSLNAQLEAAIKKRNIHLTARDAAETQLAELEIDRVNSEKELIEFHLNNLEIKSPIDGLVLRGELEDAKGASVREGDGLMEIAPLNRLRAEVLIPESEIEYVKNDAEVQVTLEGFRTLSAVVQSIRPEAEIRDGQNVFVAIVEIPNRSKAIFPGMRGRAKIFEKQRTLGWTILHGAAQKAFMFFR